jgi:PPOX class probable F420-dependent enzyme
MPSMTQKEIKSFLGGRHLARLATVRENGAPFVVPVWFDWDGAHFYVVGRQTASWVKNIQYEPRIALLVDELDPNSPKVVVEGKAKIIGDKLEDWIQIGRRMVKKYYGSDAGDSYLEGSIDQPRFTIRIIPRRITTWRNPSDEEIKENPRLAWHHKYYSRGTKWDEQYRKKKSSGT